MPPGMRPADDIAAPDQTSCSILFIDAYDSFSNNIIALLRDAFSRSNLHGTLHIRILKVDDTALFQTESSLASELAYYDAVVCGPGPGHPGLEKDVGLMRSIWRLHDAHVLPVLGICLGFQSLCLEFGGTIRRLRCGGLHGMVKNIHHIGDASNDGRRGNFLNEADIFAGVQEVRATLYQSLCADIGQDVPSAEEWPEWKWRSFLDLQPLAWVEEPPSETENIESIDQRILIAARHIRRPFWGLQYHPESICTNRESEKVIINWFEAAREWNRAHHRHVAKRRSETKGFTIGHCQLRGQRPIRTSLLTRGSMSPQMKMKHEKTLDDTELDGSGFENHQDGCYFEDFGLQSEYIYQTLDMDIDVSVADIVESLRKGQKEVILLESSNCHVTGPGAEQVRGRYSIIGQNVDHALKIEYQAGDVSAKITQNRRSGQSNTRVPLQARDGIWVFLADFLRYRQVRNGLSESPFWGGFIGYTTFELGLETIGIPREQLDHAKYHDVHKKRPDLCFVWVTESVVVDHLLKKVYVQTLISPGRESSDLKLDETVHTLKGLLSPKKTNMSNEINDSRSSMDPLKASIPFKVDLPTRNGYEAKVSRCQDYIHSGDSYELCLTDQSHVTLSRESRPQDSSWTLYKALRLRQPAPFSSFLRLGPATFISCSPERFLKWSAEGECELRPMKGTVRKSPEVSTLQEAEARLQVPKERAENLMIVDLVRHDLHSVCGAGNVSVPRLMVVEEYASVFQMITVVKGQIPCFQEDGEDRKIDDHTGIDVLAASLPPGSMTGAPKKRACELLREIEGQQDRSLYSGVVGYLDVGGRGDFSVNIRCMFRWDDEVQCEEDGQKTETWHVGAGGAVTALSTPLGEREEMETKLAGTLKVFGIDVGGKS